MHSDSGVDGPEYSKIVGELRSLEPAFPGVARTIEYGKTLGGNPLLAVRIGRDVPGAKERPAVLVTGTIHGNEFLGVENRLPRWLLENQNQPGVAKFLAGDGLIYLTPILNPDGYEANRRENNRGQDLNRDFDLKLLNKNGFTQPETKSLRDFLANERKEQGALFNLTVDYHCCVGALIYPWGYSETAKMPRPDEERHKRVATMMLKNFPGYFAGRGFDVVDYIAIGASDDYFHEAFGATSFTFEGADGGKEARQFERHTAMWDQLFADQAAAFPPGGSSQSTRSTLFVAVAGEVGGQLYLALGAPASATSLALCRGQKAGCTGASPAIVAHYSQNRLLADRKIFSAPNAISIANGDSLTILSYDGQGQIMAAEAVQMTAH